MTLSVLAHLFAPMGDSDFAILSNPPAYLRFYPAEEIRSNGSPGYETGQNPFVSGRSTSSRDDYKVDLDKYCGVISRADRAFYLIASSINIDISSWLIQGRRQYLGHAGGTAPYVECPYVYGDKALEAVVTSRDTIGTYWKPESLHVRLPANGKPAPVLPSYEMTLGDWRLQLKPRVPLGPAFPLEYEAAVKDSKNSVFLIRITSQADHAPVKEYRFMLRSEPGRPGVLNPYAADWLSHRNKDMDYVFRVRRLAAKTFSLRAVRVRKGGMKLIDAKGRTYVSYLPNDGFRSLRGTDGVDALRVASLWMTWDSGASIPPDLYDHEVNLYLRGLRQGQVVSATSYKIVEERMAKVSFTGLPPEPG